MNLITSQCQKIATSGRLGMMTHVVAGYPTIEETRQLVRMMVAEGVDFIELQIPFSDPIGDGPTIRVASTAALEAGARVQAVFDLVRQLRHEDQITIPLLLMTYYNIVFAYGRDKFCAEAERVGVNGLIIPDYNPDEEEIEHLGEYAKQHKQQLIKFAALNTTSERMNELATGAEGFLYCFGNQGVTGVRAGLDPALQSHLQKLRQHFSVPLAVGFGISTAQQVAALRGQADIIVVGSALIKAYEAGGLNQTREKIKELVGAL